MAASDTAMVPILACDTEDTLSESFSHLLMCLVVVLDHFFDVFKACAGLPGVAGNLTATGVLYEIKICIPDGMSIWV